jgi:hypothetical protein
MQDTDQAVLGLIERTMLLPDAVTATLAEALQRLRPADGQEAERGRLEGELARVEAELGRLTEAIVAGGPLTALVERLQAGERQLEQLRTELGALVELEHVQRLDLRLVEPKLREVLDDWRAWLAKEQPQPARQILRKLLDGRLRFSPDKDGAGRFYRFEGVGRLEAVLSGALRDQLPKAVVAPTGFEPVFECDRVFA